MTRYAFLLPFAALAAAGAGPAAAQAPAPCTDAVDAIVDVAGTAAQRLRIDQLDGRLPQHSLTIRRASPERKVQACAQDTLRVGGLAAHTLPLRVRALYNSAYPLNVNTGAVWAGAGVSTVLEAGAGIRIGPLRAAFYPTVAWQQNADFPTRTVDLEGFSPDIYPGHAGVIDWPQRHGDAAFWTLHPGQSAVWIEAFGAAAGVSTENLWIGSAQRTPLMLSNTAPGFAHVFLGTAQPVRTPIGSFEAQTFWGQLRESPHFDFDPDNDRTLLVGSTLVWQPAPLDGLFLGAHRSFLMPWDHDDWSAADRFIRPFLGLRGNPPGDNKLLALFARWVMPAARFELYGEWGREDGWGEWADLLREPDHSQAMVLGLQKLTGTADRTFRWWGEVAHLLHATPVRGGRGVVTWYLHGEQIQGYTHRGQLLGAWIGPGSDSQIIGVDMLRGAQQTGLAIERVRFDADAYYNQWARFYGETGHDAALSLWLRHAQPLGRGITAGATASVTRRQNRHFIRYTGAQPPDMQWETNAHLDVELRWLPQPRDPRRVRTD